MDDNDMNNSSTTTFSNENFRKLQVLLSKESNEFNVTSSGTLTFTFIACILLLILYSCCWFNRFYLRSNKYELTLLAAIRSNSNQNQRNNHQIEDHEQDHDQNLLLLNSNRTSNNDRTNNPANQGEIIRRYDIDVESLPSYTIVSGLPTYDDALEEFRKAGIIIQPPSVIKIFEDINSKTSSTTTNTTENINNNNDGDNISLNSCIFVGSAGSVELNPDQLKILSQKRLSLQIAVSANVRRSSRGRIDLCREVNRSNLLRSHDIPQIHRSTSSLSNDRVLISERLKNFHHRGSLY